jgi:hypothetical protein
MWGVSVIEYTWEVKDMMPVREEPHASAMDDFRASMQIQLVSFEYGPRKITFVETWRDLGEKLDEWMRDFVSDKKELKQLAAQICTRLETRDEKLKALYYYVRDEIETREWGGIFVEDKAAEKILNQKYGDTAEKNILLIRLLNSLDIEAYPLYIGTRDDHGAFNPALRQLSQFNHVLCQVGDENNGFALDPSEESAVYPYLPSVDLVEGGLLVDGENSRPIALRHFNRKTGTDISSTILLNDDGSAICTTSVRIRGYSLGKYEELMDDSLPPDKIGEKLMEDAAIDYNVLSAACRFDPDGDELRVEIILELSDIGTFMGENMFMSPFVIPVAENPFTNKRRYLPIDFRYSGAKRQRISIFLPAGMKTAEVPERIDYKTAGAQFVKSFLSVGNKVDIMADYSIRVPIFPADRYADVKSMFEMMEEANSDQIVLTPIAQEE